MKKKRPVTTWTETYTYDPNLAERVNEAMTHLERRVYAMLRFGSDKESVMRTMMQTIVFDPQYSVLNPGVAGQASSIVRTMVSECVKRLNAQKEV